MELFVIYWAMLLERHSGGSAIPDDSELLSLTCAVQKNSKGEDCPPAWIEWSTDRKWLLVFFLTAPRAAGWMLIPVEPYKKTAQIFDVVWLKGSFVPDGCQTECLQHRQLQFLNEAAFIMLLKYCSKQSTWSLDSHISRMLQWND